MSKPTKYQTQKSSPKGKATTQARKMDRAMKYGGKR